MTDEKKIILKKGTDGSTTKIGQIKIRKKIKLRAAPEPEKSKKEETKPSKEHSQVKKFETSKLKNNKPSSEPLRKIYINQSYFIIAQNEQ